MSNVVDKFYTYKLIYNLSKDWEDMPAFEHGIIDKNGKALKKEKDLKTTEEKKAYNNFYKVIFNLKRILEKIPLGKSTIARYSAALALLREENEQVDMELVESYLQGDVTMDEIEENFTTGIDGGNFAGSKVFNAPRDSFIKSKDGKNRFARYKTYVGEDELGAAIREYGLKNPKKGIILKDEATGAMMYFKRPK